MSAAPLKVAILVFDDVEALDLGGPYEVFTTASRMRQREADESSTDMAPVTILSKREIQVLHWVKNGKTNMEIGQILGISPPTVKNHLQKIMRKLNVNNRAQAMTEMYAGTLEHVAEAGTVGLTYIKTTDIDEQYASPLQLERDGMQTYSLRATGNAGVKDLFLSGEYAEQDKPHASNEDAWYLEAGWTFSAAPWTPYVSYRYSRFSNAFDPLFYGASRGYGTWFQGEVASNYAGPFNSNTGIHHVGLKATPLENLTVGALYFDFNTLRKHDALNLDARELDLYVEWAVNSHLIISPLVGLYQPKKDENTGGNQVGGNF